MAEFPAERSETPSPPTALGTGAPLVFCAIDTPDPSAARALAESLTGLVGGLKLGLGLFTAAGPAAVESVMRDLPAPLFLDLKLHDIPETVDMAVRAAVRLRPAFLTVHAFGGAAMLQAAAAAARDEADRLGVSAPRLLAVTVLTSLDESGLAALGLAEGVHGTVLRLADLAHRAGIDGLVCAASDLPVLRGRYPNSVLVVPGIRPAWASRNDQQKRTMTPAEAARAGADALVVGRPITDAADVREAARLIAEELADSRPGAASPPGAA